jgi:hypothetical protein
MKEETMRKFFATAVAVVIVLTLGGIGATTALAASNGAATPFKAEYSSFGAQWTCSGARVVNNGQGTFDSETCVISSDVGTIAGLVLDGSNGQHPLPSGTWQSDYDKASVDTGGTYSSVSNGDGTFTLYIVADYNS